MAGFLTHVRRNAVSYAAIGLCLAAMAGTAAASLQVRSSDIVNGQVRRVDIGAGAVSSRQAKDGGIALRDLRSNSVRTRAFGFGSRTTSDNGPVAFPLSHRTWTQRAHETDVLFGEVRFTKFEPCTNNGPFSGLDVNVKVDGKLFSAFFDSIGVSSRSNGTYRANLLRERPFIFDPGSPTKHKLAATIEDSCKNAGENVRVNSVRLIPVAIR